MQKIARNLIKGALHRTVRDPRTVSSAQSTTTATNSAKRRRSSQMERDLLQYAAATVFLVFSAVLSASAQRELRPSDHGLAYQAATPLPAQGGGGKDLQSFFGAALPPVQLPEARNVSDAWRDEGRPARGVVKDRVRLGLLVGSAVCGLAGVALLAVVGVVFLRRVQERQGRTGEKMTSSTSASVRCGPLHI